MGTALLTYTTLLFVAIATPATRSRVEVLTLSEYTALIDAFEETGSATTAERLVDTSHDAVKLRNRKGDIRARSGYVAGGEH